MVANLSRQATMRSDRAPSGIERVLRAGAWDGNVLLMRLSGLVPHRRRRTFDYNNFSSSQCAPVETDADHQPPNPTAIL